MITEPGLTKQEIDDSWPRFENGYAVESYESALARDATRKALWWWADEIALHAKDAVHISYTPPGSFILWQYMRDRLTEMGIAPWEDSEGGSDGD